MKGEGKNRERAISLFLSLLLFDSGVLESSIRRCLHSSHAAYRFVRESCSFSSIDAMAMGTRRQSIHRMTADDRSYHENACSSEAITYDMSSAVPSEL